MSENPNNSDSAKVAGSGWARPQAMRKDQNRTAWLVLLGLVCLGVATWGVFNSIYWKRRERIQKAALDMAKRTSDSFVAIAYGGVTTNPDVGGDFVSTKKFASQLDALTAAGYTPITLEDVARFYKEGRRLPAKSLLITFENSRRSSYFTTGSLLEKRRWHAVMGVVTDDVRKEVEGVILAPYARGRSLRARTDERRCSFPRPSGCRIFRDSKPWRSSTGASAPTMPRPSRFSRTSSAARRGRSSSPWGTTDSSRRTTGNCVKPTSRRWRTSTTWGSSSTASATTTPSPTRAALRGSRWIPRGAPTSWCASLTACGRARYPAAGTTRASRR